tara:strand:- start:4888 stop:6828 length:1941 start_codon:yes stop_codon:yes gene_type:complete
MKYIKNYVNDHTSTKLTQTSIDMKVLAADVQTKLVALEGVLNGPVGTSLVEGVKTLSKTFKEGEAITTKPVMSLLGDTYDGTSLKEISTELPDLSKIVGDKDTVKDITHGMMKVAAGVANSVGINQLLSDKTSLTSTQIEQSLTKISPVANEISDAIGRSIKSGGMSAATFGSIKKDFSNKLTSIGNPMKGMALSDEVFGQLGPIGMSKGNIYPGMIGSLMGSKIPQVVGETLSTLSPEELSQGLGEIEEGLQSIAETVAVDMITKDGMTRVTKAIEEKSAILADTIKQTISSFSLGSDAGYFTGFQESDPDLVNYKFEIIDTLEEFEAELRAMKREVTTLVTGWTGFSGPPEKVNARTIHRIISDWAKKNVSVGTMRGNPSEFGLQSHLIILKNGCLQRGRPLGLSAGNSLSKFPKRGLILTIVADQSSPANVEQSRTLDLICKAFYRWKPGGQIISLREIDEEFSGPGFDMKSYLSSKYYGSRVYKKGESLSEAYSSEELVNKKPRIVNNPSIPYGYPAFSNPSPDDQALLNEVTDPKTGMLKEQSINNIDTDIKDYETTKNSINILKFDIEKAEEEILNSPIGSDARDTAQRNLGVYLDRMKSFNKTQNEIRQRLFKSKYRLKDGSWSKDEDLDNPENIWMEV